MKNYFSLYGIEPSFLLDEKVLRQKYLQLSRETHPDFFGLASDEKQAEALELSTLNNEAYEVLSDFEKRFAYLLNLHGLLDEEKNKKALPQDFLMEMMEVNEALMELEFSFDQAVFEKLQKELFELKNALYNSVEPFLINYSFEKADEKMFSKLLEYYLKNRYVKRLEGSLNRIHAENS